MCWAASARWQRIVTGAGMDKSGGATVWDAETGKELCARGEVSCLGVAYSPDGKRIVTGDGDVYKAGEVKVWDAATGQAV